MTTDTRSRRLGASEVAAILGIPGAYKTPFGVWAAKRGLEQPDSAVTRRGRYLERGLLDWLRDETGAVSVEPGAPFDGPWCEHRDWPVLGCHPDGELRFPDGHREGAEIKTARDASAWGSAAWGAPEDDVPPAYWVQCQVSALLVGLDWRLGVYLPIREEFRAYAIPLDPELATELAQRATAWWQRHVVGDLPPDLDSSEDARRWLLSRFPRQRSALREATAEEAALVQQLAAAKAAAKAADAEERRLGALVQAAIGDAEGLSLPGGAGKATWKAQSSSRVDVTRLKTEEPETAARFTTTTESRVLRLSIKGDE